MQVLQGINSDHSRFRQQSEKGEPVKKPLGWMSDGSCVLVVQAVMAVVPKTWLVSMSCVVSKLPGNAILSESKTADLRETYVEFLSPITTQMTKT